MTMINSSRYLCVNNNNILPNSKSLKLIWSKIFFRLIQKEFINLNLFRNILFSKLHGFIRIRVCAWCVRVCMFTNFFKQKIFVQEIIVAQHN